MRSAFQWLAIFETVFQGPGRRRAKQQRLAIVEVLEVRQLLTAQFGTPVQIVAPSARNDYGLRIDVNESGSAVAVYATNVDAPKFSLRDQVTFQRLDASGDPVGAPVAVRERKAKMDLVDPDVAMLDNGSFAISWTRFNNHPVVRTIMLQCYSADGIALNKKPIQITPPKTSAALSHIESDGSGHYFVEWLQASGDGESNQNLVQQFDSRGNAVGQAFELPAFPSDMDVNSAGQIAFTMDDYDDKGVIHGYLQTFTATGTPISQLITAFNADPAVRNESGNVLFSDGGVVTVVGTVPSTDSTPANNSYDLVVRKFNSDGAPLGDQETLLSGAKDLGSIQIGRLPNGGLAVAWQISDFLSDVDYVNVQFFNGDFTPTSDIIRMDAEFLSLAMDTNSSGNGLLAWQFNKAFGNDFRIGISDVPIVSMAEEN